MKGSSKAPSKAYSAFHKPSYKESDESSEDSGLSSDSDDEVMSFSSDSEDGGQTAKETARLLAVKAKMKREEAREAKAAAAKKKRVQKDTTIIGSSKKKPKHEIKPDHTSGILGGITSTSHSKPKHPRPSYSPPSPSTATFRSVWPLLSQIPVMSIYVCICFVLRTTKTLFMIFCTSISSS